MFNGSTPLVVAVTTASFAIVGSLFLQRWLKIGRNLPPGPPGLPFLGNVLQVPPTHLATYFREIVEKYGSLVSLNMAGQTLILIGDMEIGKQLLERQGAKHSSRPVIHYFRKYVDPECDNWALIEDGPTFTIGRKLTVGIMSLVRAGKTEPLQEFEAMVNIQHLLDDGGKNWFDHMNRVAASTVLSATFGLHCPTGREPELAKFMDVGY
ncbi:hypothetical protein H0H93_015651 [Arthromyces matolae]|nr:hypothetical protein H0H93_015651 [Arthromyces matolae]